RPGPAATALHFAALHGEADVVAARIAGDDLHLGAEHAIDDARELVGISRRSGAADYEFLGESVFDLVDAGGIPGNAGADFVVGAADPVELAGVELRRLIAEKRIEGGAARNGADHRAVLRQGVVERIGKAEAAGAVHVLDDDSGVARYVLA